MRRRGRGRGRARPPGGRRGTRRPRARSRSARCMRSASVFSPRRTSHESNGPGTAPSEFWRKARRSATVGSFVAAKPPTRSEWPPRYFVVEWTTMSAPSSSGRWRYGVAKVLSTTTTAPAGVGGVGDRADVDDVQQRVRRGLEPDEARALVDRLGDAVVRGELELVALRLVDLREEPVGAAVDVVDGDDPLARRDEVHQRRRRAHAGREREAVLGALQRGEAGLERAARRVRGARVVVALVLADRLLRRRWRSGRSAR